jgi:DNA-binding NtrC family response regulator
VQPLGGGAPVKVEVRVIAATNLDLWQRVQAGLFREDLFYRLEVVPITLPPLRARREEIPFLAQHFLNRKAREHGLYPKALHPSVDPLLMAMPWSGNVRQLENAIERAIVLSVDRAVLTRSDFAFLLERLPEGQELMDSLPPMQDFPSFNAQTAAPQPVDLPAEGLDLNQLVSDVEKKLMLQSLQVTRGNKKRAAELLGLKRTTFLEKMKRLDLEDCMPECTEP